MYSFVSSALYSSYNLLFKYLIKMLSAAAAKSLQSCPTLCDPIDGSPPGSPIPGILQARTLEWVAISFSNAWKWKVKVKLLSCIRLLATPWTTAYQASPSMGFSRQEYWSGDFSLGNCQNWVQGIKLRTWTLPLLGDRPIQQFMVIFKGQKYQIGQDVRENDGQKTVWHKAGFP